MRTVVLLSTIIVAALEFVASAVTMRAITITRVYQFGAGETAFAYARISPDGRWLAYTSQRVDAAGRTVRAVKVIELQNRRIVFTEDGIDPYWAPSGHRVVYISHLTKQPIVSILNVENLRVIRDVAPSTLGDYPSWGRSSSGREVIMTIRGHYFTPGVVGHQTMPACASLGPVERPLLSRDGKRASVFVKGAIAVRNVSDCDDVLITGLEGAKADFSADGRYLAYHALKPDGDEYEIQIADLEERSWFRVSGLPGRSLFPSWTDDGRLCFQYVEPGFSGFVIASDFWSDQRTPFSTGGRSAGQAAISWNDVFSTPAPTAGKVQLAVIWAPWISHSPGALGELERLSVEIRKRGWPVGVSEAIGPSSDAAAARALRASENISVHTASLIPGAFSLTRGTNQLPTNLLFVDGTLASIRLGTQQHEDLMDWIAAAAGSPHAQ